jgi:hypothetical protein
MVHKLQKFYALLLAPAVAGFAFILISEQLGLAAIPRLPGPVGSGMGLFIAAMFVGVALPIWLRAVLAYKTRRQTAVDPLVMLRFQHRLIGTALLTPYLALTAYDLRTESFFTTGTVLAALYAAYYFFPTKKRIDFDCRLFRVRRQQ